MRKDEQKQQPLHRLLTLERGTVSAEQRTVQLAFSSEHPVLRWFGWEILSHDADAIDLARLNDGAPLLDGHDPDRQIGVVESARVDADGKARATVRFSKSARAEEIWQDVLDGIRKKVSVGYMVDQQEPTGERKDGQPVVRVSRWTPLEISLVSIPADNGVGVGRGLDTGEEPAAVAGASQENAAADAATETAPAEAQRAPAVERVEIQMDEKKLERQRIMDINALANQYGARVADMPALAKAAVEGEWTADQFRGAILENIKPEKPAPDTRLDLPKSEAKRYSLARAIAGQMGAPVDDKLEREVTDAAIKAGAEVRGNVYIPREVLTRDWTVGDADGAGNLVGTNYMAGSFVELLRNKMVATRLGVTFMSGLTGNVAIPRHTAGATAYWVAEGSAGTESSGTIGQLTLSPKTLTAYTDISRKLILQSAPAAEGIVRSDLAQVLGIAIDTAIFHGSGTSNQPMGIQYSASVVSASRAGFGFTASTDLEGYVVNQNYDGRFAYVMRPQLAATFKSRDKGTDSGAYLIDNGMMNGYPVVTSNVIASGFVFFGDFAQVIVAEWGGLDILVDPYTASTTGTVRVVAFQSVDIGLRYAEAFSYAYSAS